MGSARGRAEGAPRDRLARQQRRTHRSRSPRSILRTNLTRRIRLGLDAMAASARLWPALAPVGLPVQEASVRVWGGPRASDKECSPRFRKGREKQEQGGTSTDGCVVQRAGGGGRQGGWSELASLGVSVGHGAADGAAVGGWRGASDESGWGGRAGAAHLWHRGGGNWRRGGNARTYRTKTCVVTRQLDYGTVAA